MSDRDYIANDALTSGFGKFDRGQELDEELEQLSVTDPETLRQRARALLTMVGLPALMDVFVDPLAGHQTKMEANKQLIELGDMKPKQGAPVTTGAGFHVTINVPAGYTPGAPAIMQEVIDITPIAADPLLEPDEPETPEPEGPKPFAIPDFKQTNEPISFTTAPPLTRSGS